jgi:predicted Zn-dependent protease
VQGESLLAMMSSPSADSGATPTPLQDRNTYAESDYGLTAYGWSWLRALRTGKYLYVDAPRPELYDQAADPKAEHDLATSSKAVTTTLGGQLDGFRQKTSNKTESAQSKVDPETQEKLAALGYVASASGSNATSKERGPDPKDKIETANLIHTANLLRDNGDCGGAIPVLRKLITREPEMAILYAKLGHCLTLEHQYAEAVPLMRKLVEFTPDSPLAHFQLGKAYLGTKDLAAAIPELEFVVNKVPQWVRPRLVLANAYVTMERYQDAIKQYDAILTVHPDNYEANLFMARVLVLSGDVAGAIPRLKKASAVQPTASDPHKSLSSVYLRLGRFDEAAAEQVEAKRLGPEPEQ